MRKNRKDIIDPRSFRKKYNKRL